MELQHGYFQRAREVFECGNQSCPRFARALQIIVVIVAMGSHNPDAPQRACSCTHHDARYILHSTSASSPKQMSAKFACAVVHKALSCFVYAGMRHY